MSQNRNGKVSEKMPETEVVGNALAAGALSVAVSAALPVASNTMGTLKQAGYFIPGRTVRTIFAVGACSRCCLFYIPFVTGGGPLIRGGAEVLVAVTIYVPAEIRALQGIEKIFQFFR